MSRVDAQKVSPYLAPTNALDDGARAVTITTAMRLPRNTILCFTLALGALFAGCGDQPEQDVEATPVGSVLTGKTTNPESYFEKVEEGNKARQNEQQYVSPFEREEPGRGALNERY